MIVRRGIAAAIVTILVAAAGVAGLGAAPAFAASGCSATVVRPYLGSGSAIYWSGTGKCSTSASRDLAVGLIHEYDFFPDVVVSTAHDKHIGWNYYAGKSICDGGGTTTYSSEAQLLQGIGAAADAVSLLIVLTHC